MSVDVPLVSVVITTHNRADLVRQAVESVRLQTHPRCEIIVVDDASSPPVRDLGADVVLARHDEPRGVCAARNTGLHLAQGDFVTFLDDDDTLPQDSLTTSLSAIATSTLPVPVAALGAIGVVDEAGLPLEIRLPPTFARGAAWLFDPKPRGRTFTVQNTLVAPRGVVEGVGGWDEKLRAWVHDDFFIRLAGSCSLQGVDHVTYRMLAPRAGRDHVSRRLRARAEAMERTLATHRALFDRHPRRQAKYLGTIAVTWLRVGETRKARAAAWRAAKLDPRRPKGLRQLAASMGGARAYSAVSRLRVRARLERAGAPVE